MIIKYVWHDETGVEKKINTMQEYIITPWFLRPETQEEFDKIILAWLKKHKKSGEILHYEIVGVTRE